MLESNTEKSFKNREWSIMTGNCKEIILDKHMFLFFSYCAQLPNGPWLAHTIHVCEIEKGLGEQK